MPNTATTGETCFRLIYRSHSLLPKEGAERQKQLTEILKKSRQNNPAKGLTGALVLYDDWFAQVLEGEKSAVQGLLNTISADDRHNGVKVYSEEEDVPRAFGKWAMAQVSEHGEADIPLVPLKNKVTEGAEWQTTMEQEVIIDKLRNMTRGYGVGA